jgi:hypothetical protein
MVNAPLMYATNLAMRSTQRLRSVRNGDPDATLEELIDSLDRAATILADVARGAPPEARGFHGAGMADSQGFIAMACDEILIHAYDICGGLGLHYAPPAGLCGLIVRRLFPWAPPDTDAWETRLLVNGRVELTGYDSPGTDWYWQCAPLSEWDGKERRRSTTRR